MKFLESYFKYKIKSFGRFLTMILVYIVVFSLYGLDKKAIVYPTLICFVCYVISMVIDLIRTYYREKMIERREEFPSSETVIEEAYRNVATQLQEEKKELVESDEKKYQDMVDYYTEWVHQIKTPIASIRLNQQNEDSSFSRMIGEDIMRIEQYVEMVLAFLRLDSQSSDYYFREYELDPLIKATVKKYSTWFIHRKISLSYEPVGTTVLTDEKWLSFVLEQILNNALKYTKRGTISIYLEGKNVLCIKDTGIGIAASDLPRIFERGFTGYNGRLDKKASGLGLFMCKQICDKLGHEITAESVVGEGTIIRIIFN